jgi:hypothetical protein
VTVIAALAGTAFAQIGSEPEGVIYRRSTEATLTGTVEAVGRMQPNGFHGVYFTLRAESALIEVYVGPAWFTKQQNFEFMTGDALSVTGSRVVIGGQNALVARVIKKGDKVLTVRNADGFPRWVKGPKE